MIKLVDSCSSSQAHYQFNDKLSEELLFDRQSNFFQVRSRRLNDFPLIHLFSCHTSSTTNCSLILIHHFIHPSQISVFFDTDQSVITKITRDAKRTWSDKISWVSFVFLFVGLLKTFFSDRRQHGALHRVFGHQRN